MAGCVPERVEENRNYPGMAAEEIQKYIAATGVERRHCAIHDGSICTSDLCQKAAEKLLNELLQEGIDTNTASRFTPIAFAAEDDDESEVLKKIVKTVFKTPETGIVTITDRFKSMK